MPFSEHHIRVWDVNMLINGDVDLDYVDKVVSSGSPHCEVISFPFEVSQYLGGDTALNWRA